MVIRMTHKHNQRQRKKLRLGEFKELGFAVSASLRGPLDGADREAAIDAFLEDCIEPNGMLFGGGINEMLDGYVVSSAARSSATDRQREIVRGWLSGRPEFAVINVSPLTDAWHGPFISPFVVSDHLDSEEAIAAYLKAVREENDPEVLRRVLDDVEKARARLAGGTDRPPLAQ